MKDIIINIDRILEAGNALLWAENDAVDMELNSCRVNKDINCV